MISKRKIRRKFPPKCECSTDVDYSRRTPVIIGCKNDAIWNVEISIKDDIIDKHYAFVCDECLPRIEKEWGDK